MVRALILALAATLLFPVGVYATEVENEAEPVAADSEVHSPVSDAVTSRDIQDLTDSVERFRGEIISELTREPEIETETEDLSETYLKSIDETLQGMAGNMAGDSLVESAPLRASNVNVVAYSNVTPTGTYASYAAGMLPRLSWEDEYVYVQDASNSYIFIWGDLEKADSQTIRGSSCEYVRWYYSGQQLGYLQESGTADVSVTTQGHVVLSSLDGWPMIESQEVLRREVAFYALVAACVFSLASVWGFCVRLRGAVSVS